MSTMRRHVSAFSEIVPLILNIVHHRLHVCLEWSVIPILVPTLFSFSDSYQQLRTLHTYFARDCWPGQDSHFYSSAENWVFSPRAARARRRWQCCSSPAVSGDGVLCWLQCCSAAERWPWTWHWVVLCTAAACTAAAPSCRHTAQRSGNIGLKWSVATTMYPGYKYYIDNC